ncbi:hypothetical protein [Micromonospora sp. NPDC003776]
MPQRLSGLTGELRRPGRGPTSALPGFLLATAGSRLRRPGTARGRGGTA